MTSFTGAAGSSDWFYIKHTHLGFPDDTLISNWTTSPGLPATGDAISIAGFSVTNGGGNYSTLYLSTGSSLSSGSNLGFSGAITNAGLIALLEPADPRNGDADLSPTGSVTLSGGGTLQLVGGAYIRPLTGSATFTNADNLIEGAGTINSNGGNLLTFNNYAVVNANSNTGGMAIRDTVSVLNNGTIEATGSAGLIISNTTLDSSGGGTLVAAAGSKIYLQNAVLKGSLSTTGSGIVDILVGGNGEPVTFDGSASAFTTSATIVATDIDANTRAGALKLKGQIINTGTINNAGNYGTPTYIDAAGATLSGGGQIVNPYIEAASSGVPTFTNNSTIMGYGALVGGTNGGLAIVNTGTVNASDATRALTIQNFGGGANTFSNSGTLEGTGTAGLTIDGATIVNTGGLIAAAAGSVVNVAGTIAGGSLSTAVSGVFNLNGGVLDGASHGAITSSAAISVGAATISGTFQNNGTITLSHSPAYGTLAFDSATLTGSGSIVLSNGGQIDGAGFTDNGNTISGDGFIRSTVDLEAGGVINANTSGATLALTQAVTNNGLMLEATNGATLALSAAVTNKSTISATGGGIVSLSGVIDNTAGTISVSDGSRIDMASTTPVVIFGGNLTGSGSGVFHLAGDSTTIGKSGVTTTSSATFTAYDNATLQTAGTFVNNGAINLGAAYWNASGTLQGSGAVNLNRGVIYGSLLSYGNTISGNGEIGESSKSSYPVTLDLEAGAVVNANAAGQTLFVAHRYSDYETGIAITNNGTLEASNGGILDLDVTSVTGAGAVLVTTGGTVNFSSFNPTFNQNVTFLGRNAGTLSLASQYHYAGTITGFGVGDKIVDKQVSVYSGERLIWTQTSASGGHLDLTSSYVYNGVTYINTSLTFNLAGAYRTSQFSIYNDAHSNAVITLAPRVINDFNGDGRSDVLFRDPTGALATWQLTDAAISGGGAIGGPGAGWSFEGTGDFDGNRSSDVLFQSAGGMLALWEMDGTAVIGGGNVGNPGAGFSVVGIGDFNGDGASDILFRNAQNNYAIWEVSGTTLVGGGNVGSPGAGWTFKATGDFNGDGKSDILFENAQGVYAVWNLNGASISGGGTLGAPGSAYAFKGVGDFNGDVSSDILFENAKTGVYAIWDISGDAISGGGNIGSPGSAYVFKAIGDYNGDGKSDILFKNTATGAYATWDLNNTSIIGGGTLGNPGASYSVAQGPPAAAAEMPATIVFQNSNGTVASWTTSGSTLTGGANFGNPGAGYTAIGIGDFNGDGQVDVLFQNAGALAIWQTNGSAITGGGSLGAPGGTFAVKGIGDFNGDRVSDILFEDATGNYALWDVNGTHIIGGGSLGNPGGSFSYKAVGDFNGDGTSDVLFEDASGKYAIWEIGDNKIIGGGDVGNPGAGWTFKGTGDFNGDGKSDLLFENASGVYATWDLNGNSIVGGGTIGNPGSGFVFQAIADLNGDHHASIIFHSTTDNTLATWRLNDTAIVGGGTVGNPGGAWSVVGSV